MACPGWGNIHINMSFHFPVGNIPVFFHIPVGGPIMICVMKPTKDWKLCMLRESQQIPYNNIITLRPRFCSPRGANSRVCPKQVYFQAINVYLNHQYLLFPSVYQPTKQTSHSLVNHNNLLSTLWEKEQLNAQNNTWHSYIRLNCSDIMLCISRQIWEFSGMLCWFSPTWQRLVLHLHYSEIIIWCCEQIKQRI